MKIFNTAFFALTLLAFVSFLHAGPSAHQALPNSANVALAMEPASWLLVGFGLLGGGFLPKRRLSDPNLLSPAQTSAHPRTAVAAKAPQQSLRDKVVLFRSTSQARQVSAHVARAAKACASFAAASLLVLTAKTAWADTITFNSQAVSNIALSPSSDTFSLNSESGTIDTTAGAFVFQTGDFVIGNSQIPDQNISFSFQDTLTLNDITQTITLYGQDAITQTADTLTIFGGAPVAFGDELFSVQDFNLSENNMGDFPVDLEATITPTPEPSSLLLLGTGILCIVVVLNRAGSLRFHPEENVSPGAKMSK